MTSSAAAAPLRFGRFTLQVHERRLLVDGEPAAIGARAFDLLLALAERAGRLVKKRDLMALVWPGLVVQDNNLAAQMSALRKVLGEGVIATIPGRGYRFIAHLLAHPDGEAPHGDAPVSAAAPRLEPPTLRTNLPAGLPAWMRSLEAWAVRSGDDSQSKRATITVTIPRVARQWPPLP